MKASPPADSADWWNPCLVPCPRLRESSGGRPGRALKPMVLVLLSVLFTSSTCTMPSLGVSATTQKKCYVKTFFFQAIFTEFQAAIRWRFTFCIVCMFVLFGANTETLLLIFNLSPVVKRSLFIYVYEAIHDTGHGFHVIYTMLCNHRCDFGENTYWLLIMPFFYYALLIYCSFICDPVQSCLL